MRICHVAPELLPVPPIKGGAIERWVRDAAVRLAGRGHEVHVISRDRGDGAVTDTIDGVNYHYVAIPRWLDHGRAAALFRGAWYYLAVRRVLSRLSPEIVHHHSRPAGLWLSHPAGSTSRLVISLHSMDYGWGFGYRAWDRRWFARGLGMAARVLCVSKFIERHTTERYPAVRDSVTTVYNGVDGNLFAPQDLKTPGPQDPKTAGPQDPKTAGPQDPKTSRPQDLRILYVGRVEARKGVKVLVDAFEQVISKRSSNARLRIVGPHSYWDAQPSGYYAEIKARCDANDRIELRGPTYVDTELAEIYRDAAVSVVPSTFPEALGLTSIEAQASGTPVVVSDAGGLPETVAPGVSGLVFANGNVEQLGDAVLGLLNAEPRRAAMAVAARQWAMQTFSWETIASELEAAYTAALQAPRAAA
ncbi:MAG: glycosyltransferase family 4 protein [Vicinamibacterales bacterium]